MCELRRVPSNQLAPNPKNWRLHPLAQHNALRSLLSEIGISTTAVAVERPEDLILIDSHLHSEILGDEIIPVLIVDLTDSEAVKLLTTFDSVSDMATSDPEKLEQLLSEISTQSEAVQQMLDKMASDQGITPPDFSPTDNGTQGLLDQKQPIICPHCGEEFTR